MKYIVILLGVLALSACQKSAETQGKESSQPAVENKAPIAQPVMKEEQMMPKTITLEVTVKHLKFEGGFYGLVSTSGKKLLPMNLDAKYKKEGTLLKVSGYKLTDVMTTTQWGTPFELTNVELLKAGKSVYE